MVVSKFEVELLTAQEALKLIRRRPHFVFMVLGQYALSVFGFERSRTLRAAYLPIRYVDDLLDGDAYGITNPLDFIQQLQRRILEDQLTDSSIDRQLNYALSILEDKARLNDQPRLDFVRVIDTIVFDRLRAQERRLLTGDEIEQYYRSAFDPVMNISLQAIDSQLRSSNVPALSFGQGRVYSARDLRTDWTRGVINIPGEVLFAAGLTAHSPLDEVKNNIIVIDWFKENLRQTKLALLATQILLKKLPERQTQVVCNRLIVPLLKYIEHNWN